MRLFLAGGGFGVEFPSSIGAVAAAVAGAEGVEVGADGCCWPGV